jgi:hypothetical protein
MHGKVDDIGIHVTRRRVDPDAVVLADAANLVDLQHTRITILHVPLPAVAERLVRRVPVRCLRVSGTGRKGLRERHALVHRIAGQEVVLELHFGKLAVLDDAGPQRANG